MTERDLNSKRALSGATAIVRLSDIEAQQELDDKESLDGSLIDIPDETMDIDPASLSAGGCRHNWASAPSRR